MIILKWLRFLFWVDGSLEGLYLACGKVSVTSEENKDVWLRGYTICPMVSSLYRKVVLPWKTRCLGSEVLDLKS